MSDVVKVMIPFVGRDGTIQHMYHFSSIKARVSYIDSK